MSIFVKIKVMETAIAKTTQLKRFKIKKSEKLARHTSFGLGGPAKYFATVGSPQELVTLAKLAKKNKWRFFVLGGGSNTVFADKGFAGLVVKYDSRRTPTLAGVRLVADAGCRLSEIITLAIDNGLGGLEYLSGIPGTVGGALIGNAGAYEHFIGDLVEWVEIFDGRKIRRLGKSDCRFGYRDSVFKKRNWLVLRVCLELKKGDKLALHKVARNLIIVRDNKYNGLLCAGSFFKNVPLSRISKTSLKKIDPTKIFNKKVSVGYLIEASGGKGLSAGKVAVADFHANFLINRGGGTTRDLKKLAEKIKRLVKQKFGITLEEEVHLLS